MHQDGIDAAEEALAKAALGQSARHVDDLDEVGQDARLDAGAEHLAQEQGGEAGALAGHLLEGPDVPAQRLARARGGLFDRLQPLGDRRERGVEDRDVEAPLAPEVVADERLVDPRPGGQVLEGDAVEAPLGEQRGACGHERAAGGRGVALLPLTAWRRRLDGHADLLIKRSIKR